MRLLPDGWLRLSELVGVTVDWVLLDQTVVVVISSRWAHRSVESLADARPEMPEGITDRPADVWEPPIAIADAAGGQWPSPAKRVCI